MIRLKWGNIIKSLNEFTFDIKSTWRSKYNNLNEAINKVGYNPDEEYSDMPIDWDASDIQMLRKWDENTIREFMKLPPTFIAIYKAIVDVNELDAHIGNEDDPEGEDNYDWDEFRSIKNGFPPIVITREINGRLLIVDGNHRVYWAQRAQKKNYKTIGVWVVDKMMQKDIDRKNKRSLKETRIINPEESLLEGYITLYHGTTWPIALKAKKGELGPQNMEKLITDILIKVYHETPINAKEIFDKYTKLRSKDPNFLFLTTSKEGAEKYARSNTKYGGEMFYDVLSGYLWSKNKKTRFNTIFEKLKTDEPAVITINVPLEMVLSHPNWNTPLRHTFRRIRKNMLKNPELKNILSDNFNIEVFVKDKIPKRFIQRIDKVAPEGEKVDKIYN